MSKITGVYFHEIIQLINENGDENETQIRQIQHR